MIIRLTHRDTGIGMSVNVNQLCLWDKALEGEGSRVVFSPSLVYVVQETVSEINEKVFLCHCKWEETGEIA